MENLLLGHYEKLKQIQSRANAVMSGIARLRVTEPATSDYNKNVLGDIEAWVDEIDRHLEDITHNKEYNLPTPITTADLTRALTNP